MLWFGHGGDGPSPVIPLLTILILCFFLGSGGGGGGPAAILGIFLSSGDEAEEEAGGGEGGSNLLLALVCLVGALLAFHRFSESLPSWSFGGGDDDDEGFGIGTVIFVVLFFILLGLFN